MKFQSFFWPTEIAMGTRLSQIRPATTATPSPFPLRLPTPLTQGASEIHPDAHGPAQYVPSSVTEQSQTT